MATITIKHNIERAAARSEAAAGVVCNGLFARRGADLLLMANPQGVEVIHQ